MITAFDCWQQRVEQFLNYPLSMYIIITARIIYTANTIKLEKAESSTHILYKYIHIYIMYARHTHLYGYYNMYVQFGSNKLLILK